MFQLPSFCVKLTVQSKAQLGVEKIWTQIANISVEKSGYGLRIYDGLGFLS